MSDSLWLFSPLLILPLLGWFAIRRPREAVLFPTELALSVIAALCLWTILMFLPGSTTVHHGAYFTFVGAQLLIMLLVAGASAWLFRMLAIGNVSIAVVLYAFDRHSISHPMLYSAGCAFLLLLFFTSCYGNAGLRSPRPGRAEQGLP